MNMNLLKIRSWAIILSLLLVGKAGLAQDDAIGKFFGRYLDDDRFTVVSISPKMFRLMSKIDWDTASPEIKQTVAKLQSLRILSTSVTPMTFYKEALARIDRTESSTPAPSREQSGTDHGWLPLNVLSWCTACGRWSLRWASPGLNPLLPIPRVNWT